METPDSMSRPLADECDRLLDALAREPTIGGRRELVRQLRAAIQRSVEPVSGRPISMAERKPRIETSLTPAGAAHSGDQQPAAPPTLRETEARYQSLFNAIDEGFCTIEVLFDDRGQATDYRFLETNAAFEQHTGMHQARGRRMREFAPKHEQHWFDIYGRVATTRESVRFENRAEQLDRWYDVYAFPFGDVADRQVAVLFKDITRRKRDEEAIRRREAELKRAQAAAHLGSWRWERRTGLFTWSEELFRIFGVDPATFQPSLSAVYPLIRPEDRVLHRGLVAGALRGAKVEPFAGRIVRPNGEERVVLVSGVDVELDASGDATALLGTVLDITNLRRAEERLHESEELFHAVADNIPQLAWMTDANGEMLWFNRRWVEYTGLLLDDMRRRGWEIVHHPNQPHSVIERWQRTLQTGESWEDTFQLRRHDGEYRWFLSRAFPIRDSGGRLLRWFGTNTDITQLRETEAALQKAHEELQRRAEDLENTVVERTAKLRETVNELETFSYSLSHDLRAPLRAMKGFSQILEVEYGAVLGEAGVRYLKRIASAANRLDQLIQDVLAYSRVVRDDIELEPVDINRLFQQLIEENPALQPPNAIIVIRSPLLPVLGHEAYLMQVISNLVYNAVKFVEPGRQPHVEIWTETAESKVTLFVRDEGIGIPKDAQLRMFGMFQRFHGEGTYEGTGIGLTIVRKAVQRMGGVVGVQSEPGSGSVFWVTLQQA